MLLAFALLGVLGLLAFGLAGAVLTARGQDAGGIVHGGTAAAAAVIALCAAIELVTGGEPGTVVLPLGVPWLGAHFRLDDLSAFFVLVVNLGAVAAAVFGIGYGHHAGEPGRVLPFLPAFIAAMNVVLMADDAFVFLLGWEMMSLASWALVLVHHEDAECRRAALVYIVMAGIGTIALMLAFGLMARASGDYLFAAIRSAPPQGWAAALVLGLVVAGAGSKMGLFPLHAWLPLAHPAAPSHVSALMSGVMTKVAVYGLVRLLFDLGGPPEWWWGAVLLAVGAATALYGVTHAVVQRDVKRLLAFSTVDNLGVIAVGLGLALAFTAFGLGAGAAIAFTAALAHVFVHALGKTLLFLGAGSVQAATGTRDLDALGGLVHPMPWTAGAMLAGAMTIAALPPFGGFVAEWLLLQGMLLSPTLPNWFMKLALPAAGVVIVLSAALAATTAVKAFGITFLGRPRSPAAAAAVESDRTTLGVLAVLGAVSLAVGIAPMGIVALIQPAASAAVGATIADAGVRGWFWLVPVSAETSSYGGAALVLALALLAMALIAFARRAAPFAPRRGPAWDCGFPDASPATQYTAGSFSMPVRRVFGPALLAAEESVDMPAPGDMRPARHLARHADIAWERLYLPAAALVMAAAGRVNVVQFLTVRRYLSFMFAALIVLLSVVAIWR